MADTDVMPPAPMGVADEEELRKQRLLGIPGTMANRMPPATQGAAPAPTNQPASTSAMPSAVAPIQQRSEAIQPKPAMPAAPMGPSEQRLQEHEQQQRPELHGWKKALDVIGSMHPLGRAIESQIPGNPHQFDAEGNRLAMEAAREQGGTAKRQALETGALGPENIRSEIDYRNAERQKLEDAQGEEKTDNKIDEYNNDQNQRVLTFQRANGSTYDKVGGKVYEKPAGEKDKDKDIADYLEANKLEDTAPNREKARYAIAQRSKTEVSGNDARDIAAAIMRGDQPPTTTGLYRNAAAVRAELGRQGFNLAKAESDWHATQKHLATLNGAQQERLRQAVTFTGDSLGIIEGLYDQWQKVGITSGWKSFNKASLATAKQLPGQAGNIANRLEAQINDLTAELGTVYKGGNSSTDESLKLAAKNLEADWNEKTFKDALGQIKQNLEIRKNSITHSQVAGASGDNPYNPSPESTTPEDKNDPLGILPKKKP